MEWFIPMMPAGKFAELECGVCNNITPIPKWSKRVNKIYLNEKEQIKTPLRYWLGTMIVFLFLAGIIVYVAIQGSSYKSRTAAQENLLNSLRPGYILRATVNDPQNNITFFKVTGIRGDTVFVKRYNQNWDARISNEWLETVPHDDKFTAVETNFSLLGLKNKRLMLLNSDTSKFKSYYGSLYDIIQ